MREMKDSGIEWLKAIPSDWKVMRHRYIMHKRKEICASYSGEDIISLSMKGVIKRDLNAGGKFPTTFDGYQYVYPGELLLCLFDIDVTPRCSGLVKDYGVTSPAYSKFIVHKGYHAPYYNYLLTALDNDKVFVHLSKNLRYSLTEDDFGLIPTLVPPLPEQSRIAAFLDERCAKIDEAVACHKALIEKLNEYKNSLIVNTATRGIRHHDMKSVVIDWVQMMPSDWDVALLSQLYVPVKCKNIGLIETNLLSLSYGNIKQKSIDNNEGLVPANFEGYNIIENGDIVLRLTDLQNDQKSLRVGLSTQRGIVTSAYVTIRPKRYLCSRYFYYLLHSFDICKGFYGMGGGIRQGLNWDELKFLKVQVPSYKEQVEIVAFLDKKCAAIDSAKEHHQQLITKLEEYKKSLIYNAVTGKIEC